jgi:hypothetical protein
MVQKKYCGIKKTPKGKTRGNMKDCAENKQIRYFGYRKVDPKIMDIAKGKKEKVKDKNYYLREIAKRRGKLRNLKSQFNQLNDAKRLGKEYDEEKYKKLNNDIIKIENEYQEFVDEYNKLKEKEKKGGKFTVLRGGKISAKLLKELFEKDDFEDVPPYILDKKLSTEWVRVLHDPKGHTIVVHRGSADWYDMMVDAAMGLGYKGTKRFKESERIQKEAEKKYGTKNMSVIGSSLGGTLAEDFGQNAAEIISSGKPVLPLDLLTKKKVSDKQHDVRTKTDIISFLKPLQKHKNDIVVDSIKPLNPVKSHLGKHTMEAVMDEYGDDIEIGEDGVGAKEGGQETNLKKYNIKQLKEFIKINRRAKKLKASDYKLTGLRKAELVQLAEKVRNK